MIVVLLVLTVLLWGVTPVLVKFGLRFTDPLTGLIIRNLAIGLVVVVLLFATGRAGTLLKTDARALIVFSVSGLMAGLVSMWLYYTVLKIAPVSKIVPPYRHLSARNRPLKRGYSW